MAKTDVVTLAAAKATAVKNFLATKSPGAEFAALTATSAHDHNIVGIGIGRKFRGGKALSVRAIRFYVERKLPKQGMSKADLLPTAIDGVPTDVIETGRLFAQAPPVARTRLRPARPGCSIGFAGQNFVMAGTFGAVVTDGASRFILSNNHVIANENALALQSPIYQPGTLDGGKVPGDHIAKLTKFIRIKKLPANNWVDAAIAKADSGTVLSPVPLPQVGALASAITIPAAEQMRVHKHGRTTGYSRGRVIDVAADVNVTYDFGVARFVDQMIIVGDVSMFSDSGDSGSLIVDRTTRRATGLLFAGSASHTIANHIAPVLTSLGVTLVV